MGCTYTASLMILLRLHVEKLKFQCFGFAQVANTTLVIHPENVGISQFYGLSCKNHCFHTVDHISYYSFPSKGGLSCTSEVGEVDAAKAWVAFHFLMVS